MTTVITRGAGSAQALGYAARSTAANYIEDVFSTYLVKPASSYTTYSVTNGIDLSGKGGMVWMKSRDTAANNLVYDTARGASSGSNNALITNSTSAQQTAYFDYITGLSNGFTVNFATGGGQLTNDGINYASWTFRKQAKFFDVVTYTGDGNARDISHSLGSTPGCIIVKDITFSGAWFVYHRSATGNLRLNTTAAQDAGLFFITGANSTTFSVGSGGSINGIGSTYIAYLFAHNAGGFGASGSDNVISCGSYTGNGSSSGPTITLGYEPQWLLVKDTTDSVQDWVIQDVMRGMTVTAGEGVYLRANSSAADTANSYFTPLASGFQVNQSSAQANASGRTYIYIAIRRGPMRTPTSGTSVYEPQTRSGNSTATNITNVGFSPDLLIGLERNFFAGTNATLYDRLRGTRALESTANTQAEKTATDGVTGWDIQNGIRLGTDATRNNINTTGANYGYQFFRRAPGFFDEVCYTGTGSAGTINHNLSVAPELMIFKSRSAAFGWAVSIPSLGAARSMQLQSTLAAYSSELYTTAQSATTVTLTNESKCNASGDTFVAYLFASCPGVSKVGSYTGTGTTKQIDCGFTGGARFVLIKRTDSTGDWYVWDSARGIVAGNDPYLLLNSTAAEVTNTDWVDTYSAGFELSSAAGNNANINGATYIYLSVA